MQIKSHAFGITDNRVDRNDLCRDVEKDGKHSEYQVRKRADASMTVLIDTLEVSDSAVSTKFRYLYAHSSLNTAAAESISLETGNVCVV